jgi:hypothetical protein
MSTENPTITVELRRDKAWALINAAGDSLQHSGHPLVIAGRNDLRAALNASPETQEGEHDWFQPPPGINWECTRCGHSLPVHGEVPPPMSGCQDETQEGDSEQGEKVTFEPATPESIADAVKQNASEEQGEDGWPELQIARVAIGGGYFYNVRHYPESEWKGEERRYLPAPGGEDR